MHSSTCRYPKAPDNTGGVRLGGGYEAAFARPGSSQFLQGLAAFDAQILDAGGTMAFKAATSTASAKM
jgi:hypothetical protein